MGIELLDEAAYRALQRLGAFDATTSSWAVRSGSGRRSAPAREALPGAERA